MKSDTGRLHGPTKLNTFRRKLLLCQSRNVHLSDNRHQDKQANKWQLNLKMAH